MCVFVYSCPYQFVAESLKAYAVAGKLPKETWSWKEAAGGREKK